MVSKIALSHALRKLHSFDITNPDKMCRILVAIAHLRATVQWLAQICDMRWIAEC